MEKLFTTRTSNNHHSLTYKCSSKNIHIQLVWSEILGVGYTRSFPVHSIPEISKK